MKRIAKKYSSHGAFHENQILFYSCNIQQVLLLTPRPKASSIFVTDLSSGTSIKRGVSLFKRVILCTICSALCIYGTHVIGLFEDLFDCETHSRDRTNNEASQIACSRRVMIWMNGLFLTTASTLATVASWPEDAEMM